MAKGSETMANMQTTIQMFNGMSPVLQNITNTMNIMVVSLGDVSKAYSQAFDTARINDNGRKLIETEAEITQVEEAVERVKDQDDKLNQEIAQGNKQVQKFKKTWEKISGALGKVGINIGLTDILSGANDKQAAGNTLQAQTGMKGDTLDTAKQSMENLYIDNAVSYTHLDVYKRQVSCFHSPAKAVKLIAVTAIAVAMNNLAFFIKITSHFILYGWVNKGRFK